MESPKPFREKRPWGDELWISDDKPAMVKILSVNPHEELSLQFHHHRDEFWVILSGDGAAQIGEEKVELRPEVQQFVPRGTKHRLIGGNETLKLLELSFGEFDEDDIVRLEDKYGRV